MKYKATVYGLGTENPSVEVTTDPTNLDLILQAIGKQYGWVFKERWDGKSELDTEVGTIFQFDKGWPGRLIIKEA